MSKPPVNNSSFLLRLFGPPRLEGPHGTLTGRVTHRHRVALLALLAGSRGHVLTREKLIGLLWPETDTASARRLLTVSVHTVRRELGDDVLLSEGDALRLDPAMLRVDTVEFEAASAARDFEKAVACRTGPFLDGFSIPDAVDFDQWMDTEREHLERTYQASLERLAETAEAARNASSAAEWWRKRLACTPADARMVVRLMEALARSGDRAGALHVASAHATLMAAEFEAQPDPAVEAFARQIRRGELPAASDLLVTDGNDVLPSESGISTPEPPGNDPVIVDSPAGAAQYNAARLESRTPERAARRPWRKAVRLALLASVLLVIAAAAGALWHRAARLRWARDVAIPEAARLIDRSEYSPAYRLLRRAQVILPEDQRIHELLMEATFVATITTTPAGAEVFVRDYFEPEGGLSLGRSPIADVRLPAVVLAWRISHEGYETLEQLTGPRRQLMHFSLIGRTDSVPGMVRVTGRQFALYNLPVVELDGFWLDKYEVTNRQYEQFLHSAAYRHEPYWSELLDEYAGTASLREAQRAFRDSTGDSGPSTWRRGRFPKGKEDHPVGGVSWYEAAAYCAAQVKRLPTIYHWYSAAQPGLVQHVAQFSNFGNQGSVAAGAPLSLGGSGLYDMAGNVKEWTWNPTHGGRKFIAGGSWRDSFDAFYETDARVGFAREPNFGFRCARYNEPPTSAAAAFLESPARSINRRTPARGQVMESYLDQFRIEHGPLDARLEWTDDRSDGWRLERVSINAAYGGERLPILLYLPENGKPPFQTVIYFPSAGAFDDAYPVGDGAEGQRNYFLFLARSGRAVVVPTYKGTWDRYMGSVRPLEAWRDFIVYASKDLQRAVDYLETREDIDSRKLAYYGFSAGAAFAPILLATEPRFHVSVLVGGGVLPFGSLPEVDQIHYLSRVQLPTLLLNGRYDFFYPYESGQMLMEGLATPEEHKKHVLLESGHMAAQNWHEYAKSIIDWLDLYLGEVDPGSER